MRQLLIGADVGGTATRVAVADLSGTVLAAAEEAAGNPNAVGVGVSATRIRTAVDAALRQVDGTVSSVVLGMAGYGTARAARAEFDRAVDGRGARPRIVADLATAYASATSVAHGVVIIAGTGAGAAEIDRAEIVARRGAWGWLLGDEGSGFWIGREAVRWALTQIERADPPSPLTTAVLEHLAVSDLTGLLRVPYDAAPYADSPVRLADLARTVTERVEDDPAAARIADRAAELLAEQVLDLIRPGSEQADPKPPIVTGGSVLQSADRIRRTFEARVRAVTDAPILGAESGLAGALWIAASTTATGEPAAPDQQPDPAVHDRLVATLGRHRG